jgi:nucleoside-diphosphate-sugar epimerase
MQCILVTGSDGLMGREVCGHLRARNYDVIGTTRRDENKNDKTILIDLAVQSLSELCRHEDISAVVHTAAVIPRKDTPSSQENADLTRAIDANAAAFCRLKDIPVIYFSTCFSYDLKDASPKTEEAALLPATPYYLAKQDGEKLFSGLNKAVIARLSSPYGLYSAAETVLKLFLTKAFNAETITVWGSGQREQDFIHVHDAARFVEAALQSNESGIFNLAFGAPVTMKNLAETAITVCGTGELHMNAQDDPSGESYARFPVDKAANRLGWRPEVMLEKGLKGILEVWKNG